MTITVLPTRDDDSLGREKQERPWALPHTPDLDYETTVDEQNRLVDAVIELAEEVGLSDGSTPGSLNEVRRYRRRASGTTVTDDDALKSVVSIAVPDGTVVDAEAIIIGRDLAGTERCAYRRLLRAYRQGGNATLMQLDTIGTDVETSAGLAASLGVSGNDIGVAVQGLVGISIRWVVVIDYVMVTG
jgi:hypothetical protein